MANNTPISPSLAQLSPVPDYTQLLTKVMLGKNNVRFPKPSRVCSGTVQASSNPAPEECSVALDNFDIYGQATWTCRFERRLTLSGSTASWADPPPAGTRCVVVFPENETDYSPWVVTFVGYP
jgi:hypothetical protein